MKNSYHAIGIMSGSSLDGLDIVYCTFTKSTTWSFEIIADANYSLNNWVKSLQQARDRSKEELDCLDHSFGKFIGKSISDFIEKNEIHAIDIIASHGHTVYHFPEKGITKQIGSGVQIFEQTKTPTLYNLRQRDMDLGGQGAPIVPIGDLHLFAPYKYCLNLGGIANISIKENKIIKAFDICAANQILNTLAQQKGSLYDNKGKLARSGKLNKDLLSKLNKINFYKQKPPKSLDNSFSQLALNILSNYPLSVEDKLNTYCHHIAKQITEVLPTQKNREQLLITGGGAFNRYLIEQIRAYAIKKNIEIIIPDNSIINQKEALVMAFMGVLYLRNEPNCLASVTGASSDNICGQYIG